MVRCGSRRWHAATCGTSRRSRSRGSAANRRVRAACGDRRAPGLRSRNSLWPGRRRGTRDRGRRSGSNATRSRPLAGPSARRAHPANASPGRPASASHGCPARRTSPVSAGRARPGSARRTHRASARRGRPAIASRAHPVSASRARRASGVGAVPPDASSVPARVPGAREEGPTDPEPGGSSRAERGKARAGVGAATQDHGLRPVEGVLNALRAGAFNDGVDAHQTVESQSFGAHA
jgi:hypothetical protein